jgi:hypothetical protein
MIKDLVLNIGKLEKTSVFWALICLLLGTGVLLLYIQDVPGSAMILSFLTAPVVVLRFFLARKRKHLWPVTVMLAILAAGAYFIHMNARLTKFISRGTVGSYHYFLGSKYFKELGYYGLYRYTLLADQESRPPRLRRLKHIRHLEDLSTVPVKDAIAKAKDEKWNYFTRERWEEFKSDWEPMAKASRQWNRKLNDHGFNPPPFWNLIPGMIAQHIQTRDRLKYTVVRLIDLLLFLALLGIAAYVTGLDGALSCYIFVNASVILYYPHGFVDTYFQFQWLNALIATMLFYRLGRMNLAGISLAYAGMVRIFPLVLAVGPGVVWLRKLIQKRSLPRKETAFLASLVIAGAVFGLLGLTQGKGLSSTRESLQNITQHADFIKFDTNKFGLQRLMSIDLFKPLETISGLDNRARNFEDNRPIYYFLWALLMGLNLAAMVFDMDDDAWVIPLGIGLIFALMTASRYYYLVLLVYLIPGRKKQNSWFATMSISTIFLVHSLFIFYRGDSYGAFTLGNIGILFALIVFPLSLLVKKYLDHQSQMASGGSWQRQNPLF